MMKNDKAAVVATKRTAPGDRVVKAIGVVVLLISAVTGANAMTFSLRGQTVYASGPIEDGDAARFSRLPKFDTLELNSPGGLVGEALQMTANMDARGGIRTVVKPGSSCASACAMALFVSGETRIVHMGGRLGIHSCYKPDGTPYPECNEAMAANALAHGAPWGIIEGFGKYTKPSTMMWIGAEDAECWGFMKWSATDTSNNGTACFKWATAMRPPEVTAENADDVVCRMNAGSSRIHVSTGQKSQGFSEVYRKACKRVAADPNTPKYAAIDLIMWLSLTDPDILALKPGTLMVNILDRDESQIGNCWKCLTIIAMSEIMNGYPAEARRDFQKAADLVKRETGRVPQWLISRVDLAAAEAVKQNR